MRIRQVRARAFGPFEDETLDLAEGMTVIVGPNEAGKSNWHAALYAGLCGMRRGRGRRTKQDEEFAQRHQPWDGDEWEVSCIVDLPDGRRVELHHDLSGRVDCSARDLDLGTDISSEIIHDGAPDGSRWLGLERRAFLAVASIRQGQVLSVTEYAGALQEHLQRAAATAGTDETAVAALNSIDAYAREHVGTERANSQKPLMKALRRHERAKREHEMAVAQHKDWLKRQEQVGRLQARAADARIRARALEARYAQQSAGYIHRRLTEAKELAERYPTAPPDSRTDAELEKTVATALHEWANRPRPEPLTAPTASHLEERLKSLPTPPEGDLEPAPLVLTARRALLEAQARYDAHLQRRPPEAESIALLDDAVTESELMDIARELETSVPQVEPVSSEDVEPHREAPVRARAMTDSRTVGFGLGVAALASLLVGVGLIASDSTVPGVVMSVIGLLLASAILLLRVKAEDGEKGLGAVEAKRLIAEQMAATARQRQEAAAERAKALGLDPSPNELRRIADRLSQERRVRVERESWQAEEQRLAEVVNETTRVLVRALDGRGVIVESGVTAGEVEEHVVRYENACRERRELAAEARERPGLEQALDARRRAETRFAEDERRVQQAWQALHDAAKSAGVIDDHEAKSVSDYELESRLRKWQEDQERKRDEAEEARNEWSRLQALLDGGTLDELEANARAARVRADKLSAALDDDLLSEADLGDDAEVTIREASERAQDLERQVAAAQRELEVRAEQSPSVAESEEQLDEAEEELRRVRTLAEVLSTARRFLADAQDRVHHDIAPVLASKVQNRLARITGGRYMEVTVNPESLNVQVRDREGRLRNAELLSHGTAEQVYLLLRVAMAEILTAEDVSCPLLFDDSTVQSDPQRTLAILDVLHEVSEEHQVIVFSQENEVVAWAHEHLGDRDSLIPLDVEPSASSSR